MYQRVSLRKEKALSKPPKPKVFGARLPKPPTLKTAAPPVAVSNLPVRSNKTFTIQDWSDENEGEKIILYGRSGIGKTTLATMVPNPAWIGLDDGGRKIRHSVTGERLQHVPNIETFEDVRAVLQSNAFDGHKSVVIDTATELQALGQSATFRRVLTEKNAMAQNIEDYGFHKGYRHWYDTMRLILGDLDRHVRVGRNVILICQNGTVRRANPGGEDFLVDAPDLYHDKNVSILDAYVAWADHVLRIDNSFVEVDKKGKAGSTNERAVFIHPEIHFIAKSRTISLDYPAVEFTSPQDDSIWRLIFGEGEQGE